jgi:GntR family transcriptional regulator/MocR family aminotransferase
VVVRAYSQLAAEGYLDVRQGANPSVRAIPDSQPASIAAQSRPLFPKVQYDLRAHLPEVSTFPRHVWLRSVRNALASATNADLSYSDKHGLRKLRLEVSDYLGRARGVVADPDCIVITTGATHAISLLGRVLAERGSTRMAFENPSHRFLHKVARQAGQTLMAVPVDGDGLQVDELGTAQSVLVSPAHQFPTGVVLSADRRTELIAWARRTGGVVIEDDYDAEYRYDRTPIGALQGLSPEHVAYVGSTGKTLAPALRLGWAVLPPSLVGAVADALGTSMVNVSGIDQLAFADFLRRGNFDRHLRRMRVIYRRRRDVAVAALAAELGDLPVSGIAAGLHVVLELSSREIEAAVCAQARSVGVLVESVSQHALPGDHVPAGLLIGYGSVPEPALPQAIERLASAIHIATGSGHQLRSRATVEAVQPRRRRRWQTSTR